jgi:hypothetical protein
MPKPVLLIILALAIAAGSCAAGFTIGTSPNRDGHLPATTFLAIRKEALVAGNVVSTAPTCGFSAHPLIFALAHRLNHLDLSRQQRLEIWREFGNGYLSSYSLPIHSGPNKCETARNLMATVGQDITNQLSPAEQSEIIGLWKGPRMPPGVDRPDMPQAASGSDIPQ